MQKPTKIPGTNFINSHPRTERLLGVPETLVLIDKKEWIAIIDFFNDNPNMLGALNHTPES